MTPTASAASVAIMICLAGTFACLMFTFVWAANTARPIRRRAHLTGRPADPYWYTPTGRQDERGIPGA